MAVGGTRVVGSGMRVGRPAGGSSWPPRPHHPGAARPARRWWSATSATTSASPCPSPTRCCWPFAHEGTAAAVGAVYTEAVGAPSAGWSASAPTDARPPRRRPERGHGGRLRFPRLVEGAPGGPHWPVHVTLANMTRGADGRWSTVAGRWSTVAADERDLMRPAPAVDKLTQALVRNALHRRYGVSFRPQRLHRARRGAGPGAAGVCQARRVDRGAAGRPRVRPGEASRAVQWVAEQRTRGARTEAAAARAGGWDPAAICLL